MSDIKRLFSRNADSFVGRAVPYFLGVAGALDMIIADKPVIHAIPLGILSTGLLYLGSHTLWGAIEKSAQPASKFTVKPN